MVSQVGAAKDAAGWIYEFTLTAGPGHSVALAGSFNDWDPELLPMAYSPETSAYGCTIHLAPGTYEYKFVVDGEWKLDSNNPNFAPNDLGTLNSVLVVESK